MRLQMLQFIVLLSALAGIAVPMGRLLPLHHYQAVFLSEYVFGRFLKKE